MPADPTADAKPDAFAVTKPNAFADANTDTNTDTDSKPDSKPDSDAQGCI